MADKLTPKQEAFCLAYVETGNASEAYRRAYSAERMKPDVIAVKASELLKNGKVTVRVQELQGDIQKRHEITVDDLIAELEEARVAAFSAQTPQTSAAVAATMGKAKLLGFLKEKTEISGPNGGPIQTESRKLQDLTDDELLALATGRGEGASNPA
jgi:phage terminase small subunit